MLAAYWPVAVLNLTTSHQVPACPSRLAFLSGQTLGQIWPWPDRLRSDDALRQVGGWLDNERVEAFAAGHG